MAIKLSIVKQNDNQLNEPEDLYLKRNKEVNLTLVEEYMRNHRVQLSNLRGYQRELWQCATKTVADNWFFPINGCPWEKDYFTQKWFLNSSGEMVHETDANKKSSPANRMDRARWLYIYAEKDAAMRELDWQFSTATTWGVMAAELLRGTYLTMKSHDANFLVTHKQLMGTDESEGDLCIVNKTGASRTAIRDIINKRIFNGATNKYATIASMDQKTIAGPISFDNPRQKPYYVRINGRLSFSIKCIIACGVQIAGGMYTNRQGWDSDLHHWTEILQNNRDVIDLAFDKLNGATTNKTWHWM